MTTTTPERDTRRPADTRVSNSGAFDAQSVNDGSTDRPTVRSRTLSQQEVQLRPSRQGHGATRAAAFVTGVDRRAATRTRAVSDAPVAKSSAPVFGHPNRGTGARWGTVAVNQDHVEAVLEARVNRDAAENEFRSRQQQRINAARDEARVREARVREARVREARIQEGRNAHPASGEVRPSRQNGRRVTERQTRSNVLPLRRQTSSPAAPFAPRRTEGPAPLRVNERANAMPPSYASAEKSSVSSPSTRFGVRATGTSDSPVTSGRVSNGGMVIPNRSARPANGSVSMEARSSEHFETHGATALAPRRASKKASRDNDAGFARETQGDHLRVARPPRRAVKKSVAGSFVAVGFLVVVLIGASAAIILHARLAKNQLVLDEARVQVAAEERTNERLRVEVAQLEAPTRILLAAQKIGLEPAVQVEFSSDDASPSAIGRSPELSQPVAPSSALNVPNVPNVGLTNVGLTGAEPNTLGVAR